MSAHDRPILSIVIPTYNGRRLLEVCLASIVRHLPHGMNIEVIVADDASTDDTTDWLTARYPCVQVVRNAVNGGFVAAANTGLAAATGTYIQLLNNDTEVTAGWVEAGLKPLSDPTVGSVAPLVLVRSDPSRVDSAGDRYALVGWPSKRGHGQSAARWLNHPSDRVFGASGSSAIYRAEALAKVGHFDPIFGAYYEDVELAFRLRWAGYTCVYTPECRILHEVSASYDHGKPALQRRMSRNAEILFWTSLPTSWLIAGILPHLAFSVCQAAWRASRGRLTPFVQGKLDAFEVLKSVRARRKMRTNLGRQAVARPHFPLVVSPLEDLRNHLRRPAEASSRRVRD